MFYFAVWSELIFYAVIYLNMAVDNQKRKQLSWNWLTKYLCFSVAFKFTQQSVWFNEEP